MRSLDVIIFIAISLASCSESTVAPQSPVKGDVVSPILNFRKNPITVERLSALVSRAEFSSTIALDITGSQVGDDGLIAIAASPNARALRALWVDQVGAGDAGAAAIGRSSLALEELYIGYNRIGPDGLKAILEAPSARWKLLRLSFNALSEAGAQHLAKSQRLSQLKHLDLVSAGLGETGLRAILGSTSLRELETLDVSHNGQALRVLELLLDAGHLPSLRTLYASGLGCEPQLLKSVRQARAHLELTTDCQ